MGRYDIVGAQDIIGGDNDYDLDALFSGNGGQMVFGADAPAAEQAMAQRLAGRRAHMVVNRAPTKSRRFPLGFPTTVLAVAGGTININAQPQCLFRSERLVIPSDIAGSILVQDLKIGNVSMFPVSNPVPGRCFTENAVGVDLGLDTATTSQFITLSVQNTSLAAVTFNAAIIGTVIQ